MIVTLYVDEKSGAIPIPTFLLFDCITTSKMYVLAMFSSRLAKSMLSVIIPSKVLAAMIELPEPFKITSLELPCTSAVVKSKTISDLFIGAVNLKGISIVEVSCVNKSLLSNVTDGSVPSNCNQPFSGFSSPRPLLSSSLHATKKATDKNNTRYLFIFFISLSFNF